MGIETTVLPARTGVTNINVVSTTLATKKAAEAARKMALTGLGQKGVTLTFSYPITVITGFVPAIPGAELPS